MTEKTKLPEMNPIESSQFTEVGYDSDNMDFYVRFNNGKVYVYRKVSQEHFDNLTRNESPGRYFSLNIKHNHEYQKVD